MKRQALLAKAALRLQIAGKKNLPPPTGGWNSRDSLTKMPEGDAITMDNVVPRGSYAEVRGGSANHATGMTGNGKTLATYAALTGTETMFCATASGIYDVTSSGAVGASVLARTDGKHQHIMFGDGTNNWLIMCNGVDKPAYYNGTAWTAVDAVSVPALTGVTTTTLVSPMVYQGRLWFAQKDTLNVWYLASGTVGGALTKFDLSLVASRGGYVMAMINWTYDGGDGSDDRAVFVTSQGEVIVYQGVDPSSAATWEKVGTYYVGKPLGRRCLCKYGGDVLMLTEDGVIPLSSALTGVVNYSRISLSDKIEQAFQQRAAIYGGVFGWEMMVYAKEGVLIINAPFQEDGGSHLQFVMNTITKQWCFFSAWEAEAFGVLNKQLYFTVGTKTVKAWTTDRSEYVGSSTPIFAVCTPAYSNLGSKENKQVKMQRITIYNPHATIFTGLTVDVTIGTLTNLNAPVLPWASVTPDAYQYYALKNGLNDQWRSPASKNCVYFTQFIFLYGVPGAQILGLEYLYEAGSGF